MERRRVKKTRMSSTYLKTILPLVIHLPGVYVCVGICNRRAPYENLAEACFFNILTMKIT